MDDKLYPGGFQGLAKAFEDKRAPFKNWRDGMVRLLISDTRTIFSRLQRMKAEAAGETPQDTP